MPEGAALGQKASLLLRDHFGFVGLTGAPCYRPSRRMEQNRALGRGSWREALRRGACLTRTLLLVRPANWSASTRLFARAFGGVYPAWVDAVQRRTPWPQHERRLLSLAASLDLTDAADEALYAEGLRFFERQWAQTGARAGRSAEAESAARKAAAEQQQQQQQRGDGG